MQDVISFSFGQTSALMTNRYLEHNGSGNVLICFENTGREHAKTIEFGRMCQKEFGVEIILLEYRRVPARSVHVSSMRPGQARLNLLDRQENNELIHWFKKVTFDTVTPIGRHGPFDYL